MNKRFAPSIEVVDLLNETIRSWCKDLNTHLNVYFYEKLPDDVKCNNSFNFIVFSELENISYQLASRVNSWLSPLSVDAGVDDLISPKMLLVRNDWMNKWEKLSFKNKYDEINKTKREKEKNRLSVELKDFTREQINTLSHVLSEKLIKKEYLSINGKNKKKDNKKGKK